MEYFLILPIINYLLLTIICGMVGSYVLWHKLSYFGDALSHSFLLGIVISAVFNLDLWLAIAILIVIFVILMMLFFNNDFIEKDSVIAITTYFCIALAIIISNLTDQRNFNNYFLGEILASNEQDLVKLILLLLVSSCYLLLSFKKMMIIKINQDLAVINKIKVSFWKNSFLLLMAIMVAIIVEMVGIFLLTALLIIPAIIARIFAKSPLQMILYAVIISIISGIISFFIANNYNVNIAASNVVMLISLLIAINSLNLARSFLFHC